MTRIITSLSDISDCYDALFCDLWGCVHDGLAPFEEAVAAMQAFRARGGTVMLVTNITVPPLARKACIAATASSKGANPS